MMASGRLWQLMMALRVAVRRCRAVLQSDWRALRQTDFAQLDVAKAGLWPPELRRAALALAFLLSFAAGFAVLLGPQGEERQQAQAREQQLLDRYARLAFQAAHLATYREQMQQLGGDLDRLLQQLPSDAEVPALLEEITRLANGSGLAVESLSLQDEREATFYTELPIALQVVGGFHDFGHFMAGLASLPRIVTLHDFTLRSDDNGTLTLSIAARTYRHQAAPQVQP